MAVEGDTTTTTPVASPHVEPVSDTDKGRYTTALPLSFLLSFVENVHFCLLHVDVNFNYL